MSEPITFFSESLSNRTSYYDVYENEICYRPDSGGETFFNWSDIKYIDDQSRSRIKIVLDDQREIPVRYTTNDFPAFLKTICLRLADIRKENFRSQTFHLTSKYLIKLRIVVALLVLSLIVSFPISKVLFLVLLTLSIPLAIFFQNQPISLTLDNTRLIFRYLHKKTSINFHEILDVDFEVLINDYGSTLSILIKLKDRKDITIKNLEDIIIFFIMLQIKLNENIKVC
ncbi:MAG: hypothetical protein ACR2PB_00785 [Desulfocapsaceae bacterium]